MNKINPSEINSIRAVRKEEHWRYVFLSFKYLPFKTGCFDKAALFPFLSRIPDEEISRQNLIVEDKKIYYKPHVEIRTVNEYTFRHFFESVEDMENWLNKPEFSNFITLGN